ncbi:MAG TPA: hypothetical protein VM782_00925, partial [Stellaceae bacterium]|nr:hypothetical protein [Stellaceae bacterium]
LWANLHGSFLFGIALAGYLGAEAVLYPAASSSPLVEARRWGAFLAAALAATLLNPNGIATLIQPLRLMAMPALQSGFSEWRPADLTEFPALAGWLIGAVALLVIARRELRWSRVVLLVGLAYMALAHVRHADLLGLVGPLAVAAALRPRLRQMMQPAAASPLLRGSARLAKPSAPAARAVAVLAAVAISVPVLLRPVARSADAVTPQAALAVAHRLNLTGPVFNSEAFGGYLLFSGVPSFIDGRIELYGNDFLAAYLAAERGDAATLAGLLNHYHVTWTLLQAQAPAVAALDSLPGWRRIYTDEQAVIHVHVD